VNNVKVSGKGYGKDDVKNVNSDIKNVDKPLASNLQHNISFLHHEIPLPESPLPGTRTGHNTLSDLKNEIIENKSEAMKRAIILSEILSEPIAKRRRRWF